MHAFRTSLIIVTAVCLFPLVGTAQDNTFSTTSALGETGDFVVSQVIFDTVDDAEGFQFGVCHDGALLGLDDAVRGVGLDESNGGSPPGFFGISLEPAGGDGVTLGVINDLMGVNLLLAADGIEVLDITYEILGDPVLEDPDPDDDDIPNLIADVEICDTLGDPLVVPALIVDGLDLDPVIENGAVTILAPAQFCIDITCEGGLTDALVTWSTDNEECTSEPFDYFLFHRDGEFVEMVTPEAGETDFEFADPDLDPGTHYYLILGVSIPDEPPFSPATVVAVECEAEIIPLVLDSFDPPSGAFSGGEKITLSGQGFDMGEDFEVCIGEIAVPAEDIKVIDSMTISIITPEFDTIGEMVIKVSNTLGMSTAPDLFVIGFIRGDFNSDGEVSIADPLPLLEYLFTDGPEPVCFDAADANSDFIIDVADPVFVLQYLFLLAPEPMDPFPEPGLDPVDDDPFDCLGV